MPPGTEEGIDRRDRGRRLDVLRSGGGRTRAAVEGDEIGPGIQQGVEVVLDISRRDLDPDGSSAGDFAEPIDLCLQIVPVPDILERRGADDVGAFRVAPDPGDLGGDLLGRETGAHTGLCGLPQLDLDGIGGSQVLFGDAVAVRHVFEDVTVGVLSCLGQHPALARPHRRPDGGASFCERDLHLPGKGAERHMRHVDRGLDHERLLRRRPDDRPGGDGNVLVEGKPGDLGAFDQDVVPGDHREFRAHRLDERFPGRGYCMDIRHPDLEVV